MSTLTITEFLEARISEDEAISRLARDRDMPSTIWCAANDGAITLAEALTEAGFVGHHSRDRVLAECAAKRGIVGLHGPNPATSKPTCLSCGDWWDGSPIDFPCGTLQLLAAVHADHKDYNAEWAL